MNFKNQIESIEELKLLAKADRHSILISGAAGSGKSYLVRQYAEMLDIVDIQFVSPTVQQIRDAVDECLKHTNKIVLSVENLDLGVLAASYTLLKFLEEPTKNVYVIITCRNQNRVPDTIVSRSAVVNVAPPISSDILEYAKSKDPSRVSLPAVQSICKCVKSFADIDTILKMSNAEIEYIVGLQGQLNFNDTVTNIVWKLGHYNDGAETPLGLVLQYIISVSPTEHIKKAAMDCIKDLNLGSLGSQAVLSRFVFECKYCE